MNTAAFPPIASRRLATALAALLLLAAANRPWAQTAPKPETDDTVTLTPFTVSTDKDTGFAAAAALSGGRLASDLRDTPASFSVINREFIDALNLTDLQSAANWATGSTFQSDIGTFNFTTFTVRYNSRGVSAGQQQRNFFPVNGDNDSYALERYDFGRGANSILFGNGSLGGVSSSTTKRARTDRAFQDVKLTAGSFHLMRATIDVNQPINDKVAVRVAGVAQHGLGWRQKEFEKRKGAFATVTARPFRNTVIRFEAEAINREINQPINNLSDQLSGWDGKTTFATPAALATATAAQITALQAAGVGRRGANYNVYDPYSGLNAISSYSNEPITLGGGTTATTPIAGYTYGSSPAFGLTNTNLVYAMNVPGNKFDTVEAASGFRRPSERFSINQDGPLLESSFRDFQLTLEQKLGDFYVELAGDVNKNSNYTNGEQNRGAQTTYLDINRVLPDGSPNGHFGQAYGDGNFFRGFRHYDYHNIRAALAWKQDTRFGNFAISTMVGENKNHYTLSYQWLSLAQGTNTLAWLNGTTADVKIRRYWNETSRPFIDLAGKPIPYYDPTAKTTTTVTPRWVIDHTRFDTESVNDTNYRYGLAALNAKFWHDRIILLGAVRRDRYQSGSQQMAVTGDYPTDRDPLTPLFKPQAPNDWASLKYIPVDAAGRALPEAPAITRPRVAGARDPRYTQYRFQDDFNAPVLRGYVNTKSVGSVVHLLSWLSPSVNYAETFYPQKAYALLQGGGIIQPTVSTGWNYSTRFEFFQRKLDVNLTYYTSEEINNPFGVSGFPFNTLLQAMPVGSTAALNRRGVPVFISGSDLQDRIASGYEAEITANVIKGLRVTGSVSLPKVYGANAYQLTRAYVEKNRDNFKLVVQDAGGKVDSANVATVDTAVPANQQSPDVQAAVDAYNTIFTAYNNLNIARTTGTNQPLYKMFGDYTFQEGKIKGLRLGVGVQYRGREIVGNRGADTIVDPTNPARAIDDPTRSVNTPLYTPKGDYTVTSTFGYLWKFDKHDVQLQLVINNLLNDRSIYWTTSTNGTATSAQRPRDGNYASPARETVPVGFGLKQPINFNISAAWRM